MVEFYYWKKRMNFKISILVLSGFCVMQSFAQILSLDSVLNLIENNHPMLHMYDEQINALESYSGMAKSWMPPTLSMGPWQAPYSSLKDGMWMVTGEQMIPHPKKQKANYNYMLSMTKVEQHGKSVKKRELFLSAKHSYFEWIVLKKKYTTLIITDSLLNYILNTGRFKYTYNKEKLGNIYKAEAELFDLRNMETMYLNDMKKKNVELNTLLNVDRTLVFDVDTTWTDRNYEMQMPDSALIISSRSDIKQLEANIGTLKLQQEYEKAKRLPDFGFSFSHMQSLSGLPNQYSAMGMMSFPIAPWSSKEYYSIIRSLNHSAQALDHQRQALLNETSGRIASLIVELKTVKQQMENYRDHVIPAYKKSYQASMLAYRENTEELFVVLDGIKMYRMAMLNELDFLNQFLNLQAEYENELEIR